MLNRSTLRSQTKLEKAHIRQAKTWNSIEQNILAATGNKSQLSIENKLLYKAILNLSGLQLSKPIWRPTVRHSLHSNIEILQRFQNKYLRIIVNASWYVDDTLHHDLNLPYVQR